MYIKRDEKRAKKLQEFFEEICVNLCKNFRLGECLEFYSNIGEHPNEKWPDGYDGPFQCIIKKSENDKEHMEICGGNFTISPRSCDFFGQRTKEDEESERLEKLELLNEKQVKKPKNVEVQQKQTGMTKHRSNVEKEIRDKLKYETSIESETKNNIKSSIEEKIKRQKT